MPRNTASMKVRGPILTGKAGPIMDRHAKAAVQTVIEKGMEQLDARLSPRPGGVSLSIGEGGSTGDAVRGERHGLIGRITGSMAVFGPLRQGRRSRNAITRFKGSHAWKFVQQWLQDHKQEIIRTHIKTMVRGLKSGL